jgi:hypothetical protein
VIVDWRQPGGAAKLVAALNQESQIANKQNKQKKNHKPPRLNNPEIKDLKWNGGIESAVAFVTEIR